MAEKKRIKKATPCGDRILPECASAMAHLETNQQVMVSQMENLENRLQDMKDNDLKHIWGWVQATFFVISVPIAVGVIAAILRLAGVW